MGRYCPSGITFHRDIGERKGQLMDSSGPERSNEHSTQRYSPYEMVSQTYVISTVITQ